MLKHIALTAALLSFMSCNVQAANTDYVPLFMSEAAAEAQSIFLNKDGAPFGAVIVKDGKIVGRGHDSKRKLIDPTAHAEITAIRDAAKNLGTPDLSDCVIYSSAYPCPMCLSAIIWANIKVVYYGNGVEDSATAGFGGDAFIYKFFNEGMKDTNVLKVEQHDRNVTLPAFLEYAKRKDEFKEFPKVHKDSLAH